MAQMKRGIGGAGYKPKGKKYDVHLKAEGRRGESVLLIVHCTGGDSGSDKIIGFPERIWLSHNEAAKLISQLALAMQNE